MTATDPQRERECQDCEGEGSAYQQISAGDQTAEEYAGTCSTCEGTGKANTEPGRWVNAVAEFMVPMDIPVDTDPHDKLAAAEAAFGEDFLGQCEGSTLRWEDAGDPAEPGQEPTTDEVTVTLTLTEAILCRGATYPKDWTTAVMDSAHRKIKAAIKEAEANG